MQKNQPDQQPPFHGYDFDYKKEKPAEPETEPVLNVINNAKNGEDKFLRIVMLMISSIILSVSMLGGAYVAANIFIKSDPENLNHVQANLFPILLVVGLAYIVGWIVALVGIRLFHNLVLPYVMQVYGWMTLIGILILYSVILQRLYGQAFSPISFIKYVTVTAAAFVALVGFHLLPEEHNLRPFSVPLLLFNLTHLYLIMYHYVFSADANYDYLVYDITFFLGMTAISVLMLIRVGVLSGIRGAINSIFDPPSADAK